MFVLNGYFTSSVVSTVEAYTVSPAYSTTPTATTASTSSSPSAGVESYTVSGLPTTAGTVANIALFPCTGPAQTSNNTTNGAPTVQGTGVVFTAPGGTSPVAGNAIGQGTTQSNSAPTTTGFASGTAGSTETAYVASVNGVPTAADTAGDGPTQVYSVAPTNGTLSFVLNSYSGDCAVPVVYTAPSSAGSAPALLVNANGTVQTGYAVGVGNATQWASPPAPASATGYTVEVTSVNPTANTFSGSIISGGTVTGPSYSFNYNVPGSSYTYPDRSGVALPITESSFVSYLSGPVTADVPNTTTGQSVNGDEVTIGAYSPGVPTTFTYNDTTTPAYGDVPNAPTSLNATYNGAAYTSAGISHAGIILTWTPPVNPDVSGSQATAPGAGAYNADNAMYTIYRSTVIAGVTSAPTEVGTVTAISTGTPTNGTAATDNTTSVSSPEFIDTTAPTGETVVYYVTATGAGDGYGSGPASAAGQTGPYSAASNSAVSGAAPTTPAIVSAAITPSTCTSGTTGCSANQTTAPAGTAGTAVITYNEAVTCPAPAAGDFSYTNSLSTTASYGIKGASCAVTGTDQVTVTFPLYSSTFSAGVTYYSYEDVAAPNTGDAFTYTAPSTNSPSFSVYAGPSTAPVYAATQSVTDTGTPTATTTSGSPPSNPLT